MSYENVKTYRKKLKTWGVACCGGECRLCGYKKDITALEFHHLDRKAKSFEVSKNTNKAHTTYKAEILKCILLCANCHREVESGISSCVGFEPIWIDIPFLKEKKVVVKKGFRKVDWGGIDLAAVWGTKPVTALGIDFGVSDNAVRKRARKIGLI